MTEHDHDVVTEPTQLETAGPSPPTAACRS